MYFLSFDSSCLYCTFSISWFKLNLYRFAYNWLDRRQNFVRPKINSCSKDARSDLVQRNTFRGLSRLYHPRLFARSLGHRELRLVQVHYWSDRTCLSFLREKHQILTKAIHVLRSSLHPHLLPLLLLRSDIHFSPLCWHFRWGTLPYNNLFEHKEAIICRQIGWLIFSEKTD